MSNIIPLEDYVMGDREKLEHGMDCLDKALSFFDDMKSFGGKNLASTIYMSLRYAEQLQEEGQHQAADQPEAGEHPDDALAFEQGGQGRANYISNANRRADFLVWL